MTQNAETADKTENRLIDGSKPATQAQLFELLESLDIQTTTHSHEPVFTVEESEQVTAMIPGAHTKNLFVKDRKDNYFLIVVGNKERIPLNRIHRLIGAQSRVSFANAEQLMEFLGVTPGSVNAFAPMNDHSGKVKVIIDEALTKYDQINCHPLINDKTTTISREDLLGFLDHVNHKPEILNLSQIEN